MRTRCNTFKWTSVFADEVASDMAQHCDPKYIQEPFSDHYLGRLGKGGADRTELDVRERHLRIRILALDIRRYARASWAVATTNAGGIAALVSRIVTIQPQHVGVVIIPQTHHEHHARVECLAHGRHTTVLVERILLLGKSLLFVVAPCLSQAVTGETRHLRLRVGDDLATLDVEALNFEVVARPDKLGHHCEFLGCVDRLARTIEVLDTNAVRVEVTAVGVAVAGVSILGICAAALAVGADRVGLG